MNLLSEYIQPLTTWLYQNPNWALLFTFLISFSESLAIVGSIVPGSVTMTAIGILAGSGVMRVDLTFIAATLGAVAGDGASYLLGYTFSDRLAQIWPFSRYPTWLEYGKDYFASHGGKSVLIGRFVGPLRSMIPLIAGMMHMSRWRFFMANVISAIGWSVLYLLPGVLIGAASSELSPETATRLFAFILIFLVGLWLVSIAIKWLIQHLSHFLRRALHNRWICLARTPYLAKFLKKIPPANEIDFFPTASLLLFLMICTGLFILISILVFNEDWISTINQPIHLLLQSIRTHAFDLFFTSIGLIICPLGLLAFFITASLSLAWYNNKRTLAYWIGLNLTTVLILFFVQFLFDVPRPEGLWSVESGSSYPNYNLTLATVQFVALGLYIRSRVQERFASIVTMIFTTGLLTLGFSSLYLGDNWLTDVLGAYFLGLTIALSYWIFYRRHKKDSDCRPIILLLPMIAMLIASTGYAVFDFESRVRNHQPYVEQYVLTPETWWAQTKPILPIYRTNRLGQNLSLFNLQYAGSLGHLETALKAQGWQKQNDSLFHSILAHIGGNEASKEMPLMSQLYLNRKPSLVMTYQPTDGNPVQVLRVWRSNYHLKNFRKPLWIGSVHPRLLLSAKTIARIKSNKVPISYSLSYVKPALNNFEQQELILPDSIARKKLPANTEAVLLLIKEKDNHND